MQEIPADLVVFMREYGILEEALPKEEVSDKLEYEVWLPKHVGEEVPF